MSIIQINNEREFVTFCNQKYIDKLFFVGDPTSTDQLGQTYVELDIGGIKEEGQYGNFVSRLVKDDEYNWELWWDTFEKWIKDYDVIYVRRMPISCEWSEDVLNTFGSDIPRFTRRHYSQIRGRFSRHMKKDKR